MKPDFAKAVRVGRKRNPAKKTVSQKISQLVHEGYPQKQAVAVALSEQRKGKVKRNPSPTIKWEVFNVPSLKEKLYHGVYKGYRATVMKQDGEWMMHLYRDNQTRTYLGTWPSSNGKVSGAKAWFDTVVDNEAWKKPKRNPATGGKGSRTKLNPVKYRDIAKGVAPARVQYAVHMPDRPSYHAMAYFTKKADALEAAQEVSDRTGKPVAVSRVQVHFGPM